MDKRQEAHAGGGHAWWGERYQAHRGRRWQDLARCGKGPLYAPGEASGNGQQATSSGEKGYKGKGIGIAEGKGGDRDAEVGGEAEG